MEMNYLTTKEISVRYKVTIQAVQKWIRDGKLAAFKLGKAWRIPEPALQEFIEASQKKREAPR